MRHLCDFFLSLNIHEGLNTHIVKESCLTEASEGIAVDATNFLEPLSYLNSQR